MLSIFEQLLKRFSMICIASILFISGCEEPFQPIEDSDEYFFSVWGYLDSEAETQWIRVMPIRETTEYSGEPLDAVVTLTNLDTGEEVIMNDSLFTLPQAAPGDAKVWNYWTTMDILPSHTYKFKVERSDGAITTATVDIPGEFPFPEVDFNYVEVTGVNNIVEARLDWKVRDRRNNTIHTFRIVRDDIIYYPSSETYLLIIYPNNDFANNILRSLRASQTEIEILKTELSLKVAGSDWIDFSEFDRDVIALPEATSNIENGVGYLVGTLTMKIPYPVCVGDGGEIIPCK